MIQSCLNLGPDPDLSELTEREIVLAYRVRNLMEAAQVLGQLEELLAMREFARQNKSTAMAV